MMVACVEQPESVFLLLLWGLYMYGTLNISYFRLCWSLTVLRTAFLASLNHYVEGKSKTIRPHT